jgi:CRISPR type I-E-associated protein CasB/Cse2
MAHSRALESERESVERSDGLGNSLFRFAAGEGPAVGGGGWAGMSDDILFATLRSARALYDDEKRFRSGDRASLRAAKHSDDLLTNGAFWRLVAVAANDRRPTLRYAIICFDGAKHANGAPRFATSLRRTVYADVEDVDLVGRALRFRRLLASESREELVHHLRRSLRHAAQAGEGLRVDWGTLGAEVVRWGPVVRRRWAEDFYAARAESKQAAGAAEGANR